MHPALPDRLPVDDTHAYIIMECKGWVGVTLVQPRGNVPQMVKVPHLDVAVLLCKLGDIS